jgi:putative ABC transport system ATP-binding protein
MIVKKNTIAQLINVSKRYDETSRGTIALKNISFAANPGEMILLLGPSGSGKTTFLTLLAGMQRPTSGEVILFEKHLTEYSRNELQELRAKRIGFIFQTFLLLESLTVLQNVMMVMRFAGTEKDKCRMTAMTYLKQLGIQDLSDSLPSKISQGEKQRVAIARALVNGAELIIADEPTGNLASRQGMEIVELLKQRCIDENRCVIIASHDERIISLASKVLYLNDGEMLKPDRE